MCTAAGDSSVSTWAAAAWLRYAMQRTSRKGSLALSGYSGPLCGHKSVTNGMVKPGFVALVCHYGGKKQPGCFGESSREGRKGRQQLSSPCSLHRCR